MSRRFWVSAWVAIVGSTLWVVGMLIHPTLVGWVCGLLLMIGYVVTGATAQGWERGLDQ